MATAGNDGAARVWDLPPADRPLPELLRVVRLGANRRVDPSGARAPVGSGEPAEGPEPTAAGGDVHRWRRAQIAACLREGDLAAAEFHHRWLIAEAAGPRPQFPSGSLATRQGLAHGAGQGRRPGATFWRC